MDGPMRATVEAPPGRRPRACKPLAALCLLCVIGVPQVQASPIAAASGHGRTAPALHGLLAESDLENFWDLAGFPRGPRAPGFALPMVTAEAEMIHAQRLHHRPPHPPGLWPAMASHGVFMLEMAAEAASEHQLAIHMAGGRTVWPLNLAVPRSVHLQAVGGLLPDTPLVAYLHWRRSLNPARFDHFHPWFAGLLERDLLLRTSATPLRPVMEQSLPPVPALPPHTSPPIPGPPIPRMPPSPSTPEPSTALMAGLLIASAAVLRRRVRSS